MKVSDSVVSLLEKLPGTQNVFLLDVSWHMYRNYYAFRDLSVDMGGYRRDTGHMYGFLYTLESLVKNYQNALIILCLDGVPVDRIQASNETEGAGYKEGRDQEGFNIKQDTDKLVAFASLLPNVFVSYDQYTESDDLLHAIAKQVSFLDKSIRVSIYSGDDDLLQTISDNIVVVRKWVGSSLEIIDDIYLQTNETMFKKYHGTDALHLPFYRAMIGDKSDKLPGISRFQKKIAHSIAMSCSELEDIFRQEQKQEVLLAHKELIEFNYSQMKLKDDLDVKIVKKSLNPTAVMKALDTYGLKQYTQFIQYG